MGGDFDWADWFTGFDDDLNPKDIQNVTSLFDKAEVRLLHVEGYIDSSKGMSVLDEAKRAHDDAVSDATTLIEHANAAIKSMSHEISWLQEIASRYFAGLYSVPLDKEVRAEIVEWCRENLQDYDLWPYGARSILVINGDTDRVHFKLRWGDVVHCP